MESSQRRRSADRHCRCDREGAGHSPGPHSSSEEQQRRIEISQIPFHIIIITITIPHDNHNSLPNHHSTSISPSNPINHLPSPIIRITCSILTKSTPASKARFTRRIPPHTTTQSSIPNRRRPTQRRINNLITESRRALLRSEERLESEGRRLRRCGRCHDGGWSGESSDGSRGMDGGRLGETEGRFRRC